MRQETWNLLFEWITGRQCFIPEGCSLPALGIAVYALIASLLVLGAFGLLKRERIREVLKEWRE